MYAHVNAQWCNLFLLMSFIRNFIEIGKKYIKYGKYFFQKPEIFLRNSHLLNDITWKFLTLKFLKATNKHGIYGQISLSTVKYIIVVNVSIFMKLHLLDNFVYKSSFKELNRNLSNRSVADFASQTVWRKHGRGLQFRNSSCTSLSTPKNVATFHVPPIRWVRTEIKNVNQTAVRQRR